MRARIALTADLSERISVNGEPLDPPPGLALMLHKPLWRHLLAQGGGAAGL